MNKFRVPIFTEEYAIHVRVGARKDIIKSAEKYLGRKISEFTEQQRGMAFNCLEPKPCTCLVNKETGQHVYCKNCLDAHPFSSKL